MNTRTDMEDCRSAATGEMVIKLREMPLDHALDEAIRVTPRGTPPRSAREKRAPVRWLLGIEPSSV
ncbi:MAG: hypothetical protein ACR2RV_20320 [Verrucomicrobiales bacterium]